MIEKGWVTSGMPRTGLEEKAVRRVSKAFCWSGVQFHGWSFQVRRLRGVTTWEKLGMNLR